MKNNRIDSVIAKTMTAATNKLNLENSHKQHKSEQEKAEQARVAAEARQRRATEEAAIIESATGFLVAKIDADTRRFQFSTFESAFTTFRYHIDRSFLKSRQIEIFIKAAPKTKKLSEFTSLTVWLNDAEKLLNEAHSVEIAEELKLIEYGRCVREEIRYLLRSKIDKRMSSYPDLFRYLHGYLSPVDRSKKTAAVVNAAIDELVPQMKTESWVLAREEFQQQNEKRIAEYKRTIAMQNVSSRQLMTESAAANA
jgi:hypothetical protein